MAEPVHKPPRAAPSAPSHPLGELVACTRDNEGAVAVYQKDGYRYLTFGNAVEQSCIDLAQPYRLEHVYTQAMMLGLALRPDAARSLLLGLGGGSLARALHQVRSRMHIDAVELRQAVIDVARDHFGLAHNRRLHLHCCDARDFVRDHSNRYDLLMLDLYLADGVHPAQTEREFLQLCRQRLDEQGILLANHWCSEFRDSQRAQAAMSEVFGERVLYLHVQGGNTIAFGFAGALPALRRDAFFELAQRLGLQLDIPLHKLARNFWRQNAEPLKIGRFRR